jgi:hypothetical protein
VVKVDIKNLHLDVDGLWYIMGIGILVFLFMLFMPKRIKWREIYLTFGLIAGLAFMADTITAMWFDFFDLGKKGGYGLGDVMTIAIIPSALSVIFLNFLKLDKKWGYVVLFTFLSFLYEWGAVQSGFMILKGWHTWWSIPFYFLMFGLFLPWHLRVMRNESVGKKHRLGDKLNINRLYKRKEKAK